MLMHRKFKVIWNRKVGKQLERVPSHIARKFFAWARAVELKGIYEIRKSLSFHDEPLKGKFTGFRSIRLSGSYRAVYFIYEDLRISIIEVVKVSKHEY